MTFRRGGFEVGRRQGRGVEEGVQAVQTLLDGADVAVEAGVQVLDQALLQARQRRLQQRPGRVRQARQETGGFLLAVDAGQIREDIPLREAVGRSGRLQPPRGQQEGRPQQAPRRRAVSQDGCSRRGGLAKERLQERHGRRVVRRRARSRVIGERQVCFGEGRPGLYARSPFAGWQLGPVRSRGEGRKGGERRGHAGRSPTVEGQKLVGLGVVPQRGCLKREEQRSNLYRISYLFAESHEQVLGRMIHSEQATVR
ncbi:hypothetical protein VTK73DRAFT_3911 [Phialemonium thermophilum]|uniref:Uncharacterized protein n=1 Tax=Phialemonium thermophilum TaxID=223376 RepID=A0ABR3VD82_9PEZI